MKKTMKIGGSTYRCALSAKKINFEASYWRLERKRVRWFFLVTWEYVATDKWAEIRKIVLDLMSQEDEKQRPKEPTVYADMFSLVHDLPSTLEKPKFHMDAVY